MPVPQLTVFKAPTDGAASAKAPVSGVVARTVPSWVIVNRRSRMENSNVVGPSVHFVGAARWPGVVAQ